MLAKAAAGLAVLLSVLFLLEQCSPRVTSIRVRNETDQARYVSVVRTPKYPTNIWVVLIDPAADTFAVEWEGGRDVPVHVLDAECNPVGTFRAAPSGVYLVDAVPGLVGTMKDGPGYEPRTEIPGIHDTSECGGHLDR